MKPPKKSPKNSFFAYIYARNALFGDFFACNKSFRQVLLTKKSFRVHVICHVGYAFDRSIECWKKNYRSFDQIFSKSQKRQRNDKKSEKKITKNAKKG